MKRYFVITLFIVLAAAGVFLALSKIPSQTTPEAQVLPTETSEPVGSSPQELVTVTPLVRGDQVKLIANYKEQKTGEELMRQNSCDYLVNAGFYTKEWSPVGYIKTENTELSVVKNSLLFDGFVTINELQTPRITRVLPLDQLRNALQTGPMLIENGKVVKLQIKNDKEARRMFALIDGNNEILFGMVKNSSLALLPKVVFEWAKEKNILVADAINLDGGSASTYRGPNGVYPEISPIGSAFCVKN